MTRLRIRARYGLRVGAACGAVLGLLCGLGSGRAQSAKPSEPPRADLASSDAGAQGNSPEAGNEADAAPRFAFPPPAYTLVDAGWDRPIRVLPGADPSGHAIVYLHGYCGDVNAVGAFQEAARRHGTVIALLGDLPCPDKPGRFKWSRDIRGLEQRIERAVKLVNRTLGSGLDTKNITLFGYSQGAMRAESLARFYGKRYPRVILGGPPERARASHFRAAQRVAFFGGEKEDTNDMSGGAEDLAKNGLTAQFFLIPGVDHGDFGADGERVLGQVLDFVDPGSPPSARTAAAR